MSINDWPEDQRPRERLLKLGARALSDAELLAVVLGSGARGSNAVQLGQALLNAHGGLPGLFSRPLKGLRAIKGVGTAKLVLLQAVKELATRTLAGEMTAGAPLTAPGLVRDFLRLNLLGRGIGRFSWCYFLTHSTG